MKLSDFLSTNDLKPSAFAEDIGVPASTISRVLRGERSPGLDLILKIEKGTNGAVTAQDLHAGRAPSDQSETA